MSEEERVGYKPPPKLNRFKPGQSGNPRGRPKGTKNLATDLAEEFAERITMREGERRLKVSKQRALIKALVARGLKGDIRATNVLLRLIAKLITPASESTRSDELSPKEADILDRYIEAELAKRKA